MWKTVTQTLLAFATIRRQNLKKEEKVNNTRKPKVFTIYTITIKILVFHELYYFTVDEVDA